MSIAWGHDGSGWQGPDHRDSNCSRKGRNLRIGGDAIWDTPLNRQTDTTDNIIFLETTHAGGKKRTL